MGPPSGVAHGHSELERELAGISGQDAALQHVLAEAERAMARLKLERDPDSKKARSEAVKHLLDRAETIKRTGTWKSQNEAAVKSPIPAAKRKPLRDPQSTRALSKAEQIIVLKASYVNGCKFPPWQDRPSSADFELGDDGLQFTDPTEFSLSDTQRESLDAWRRPQEALPPPTYQSSGNTRPDPTMNPHESIDLVQDAATDCSVVASLCAGLARALKGHTRLMGKVVFPYDSTSERPLISPNGKYVARLYFNGTFRRVEIDDRLPVSKTQRIIHVIDRNNPSLIWPALIEKLYLKVRGGYDFPGSNSGTDLWVLSGWIPEQVFLEKYDSIIESLGHFLTLDSDDTSPAEIWRRIWNAHEYGDVMITLGTGKMSAAAEREIGLASEHDYAVIDLREEQGQRLMLVKNPWCEGSTWKGSRPRRPSTTTRLDEDAVPSSRDLLNANDQLSPGTFWMDLNNVTQHFESIYLNWNPGLFQHREDIHFAWDLQTNPSPCTYVSNPQFTFTLAKGGMAWLLLCRHFQDDRQEHQMHNSLGPSRSSSFISLSAFNAGGVRMTLKESPLEKAPFVDSYQTLLRLSDLRAGTAYTIVPDQDGLSGSKQTFSLCTFSNSPISIEPAAETFANSLSVDGSWTEDTAGGNSSSPLFSINPQYRIAVAKTTPVTILLDTADKNLPVNVKLCFSEGKRVQSIRTRDIIGDSKNYRPCCALARIPKLEPGIYTIVCSTFDAGQLGNFTLRVDSNQPIQLRALPSEGAGRLRTSIPAASFSLEEQASAILLLPQRLTKFVGVVKQQPPQDTPASQRSERSMIRVSIVQGDAYQHITLATSSDGEFRDSLGGVRTEEIDLSPAMAREADIWLVIERNFTAKSLEEETFSVEFFTESSGAVQTGDWQNWEGL